MRTSRAPDWSKNWIFTSGGRQAASRERGEVALEILRELVLSSDGSGVVMDQNEW